MYIVADTVKQATANVFTLVEQSVGLTGMLVCSTIEDWCEKQRTYSQGIDSPPHCSTSLP